MNKVVLVGNLTRDPQVTYINGNDGSQRAVARYTLAVNRRYNRNSGENDTDFIPCVAFGKAGEFAEKYLQKGKKIGVVGRIQTGSYTNREGNKVYTTDVVVEEHEFVEARRDGAQQQGETAYGQEPGYQAAPAGAGYQAQGGYAQQRQQAAPAQQRQQAAPAPAQQGGFRAQGYPAGYQPQPAQGQAPQGGQAPMPQPAPRQPQQQAAPQPYGGGMDGFMNVPDGIEEELPFR